MNIESIKNSDVISKASVADIASKTEFQPQSKTQFIPVSIARFISACEANKADITDEEITEDVRTVRYHM